MQEEIIIRVLFFVVASFIAFKLVTTRKGIMRENHPYAALLVEIVGVAVSKKE